ncbi:MAG: DUF2878 family protein [Bdellovibrionales bacterium]|nr:DUF2878 family protein [Bdellovibrionales bacterium]
MKRFFFPLQFCISIVLSLSITDNLLKTFILLLFWAISFFPLQTFEWGAFLVFNVFFVAANYGALKNMTFDFTHKDILLMPYNELFMWGFYALNAKRFINIEIKDRFSQWKIKVAYIVLFSSLFSVVHNEIYLALLLLILGMVAFYIFKSQRSTQYIFYYLFMGLIVEATGIYFNLWNYPHAQFYEIPLWTPLMWANIGLIMSLII